MLSQPHPGTGTARVRMCQTNRHRSPALWPVSQVEKPRLEGPAASPAPPGTQPAQSQASAERADL